MNSASISFFIVGLMFIGLGVPLVQRRIPRNRWYGFRVAKTYASERVWYAANAVAGRDLIVAGAVVALTAVGTAALAPYLGDDLVQAITFVVFVGSMLAATVHSFATLRHIE